MATDTSDREFLLTREFDAPRELVWQAWTDPAHVGVWWGPRGFTTTTHEIDVRPGGVWRFIMHGPDGVDYPNKITFVELAKPERLVYKHGGSDQPVDFEVTATFESVAAKTKLAMQMVFPTAEEFQRVIKVYRADEGAIQHLDRLGEHVAAMTEIVSTRVFDAPPNAVFRAFRDPEQLKLWWGPRGFTNTIHHFDPVPGGEWRYTMHGPDGTDYQNVMAFVEIAEPNKIVLDHLELMHRFRMTMTFAEQGEKTQLTWRMRFASGEEYTKVAGFIPPANEQNFDRLAAHLATR